MTLYRMYQSIIIIIKAIFIIMILLTEESQGRVAYQSYNHT